MGAQLQGLLVPPESVVLDLMIGLGLLVFFIGLMFWRWLRLRNMATVRAKGHILALKRCVQNKEIGFKLASLQLACYLRQGFSVARLDADTLDNNEVWRLFYQRLDHACYAKMEISREEMNILIVESLRFID